MLLKFHSYFIAMTIFGCLSAMQGLARAENPVILEFTSQNCAACRQIEPLVQQLVGKGYPIRQVDANAEPQLAEELGVTALPTFVVMSGDRVIDRIEGVTDGFAMERRLQLSLKQSPEIQPKQNQATVQPNIQPVSLVRPQPASQQTLSQPSFNANQHPAEVPWLQATVRIRVESPNGHDWGTGTIIDARGGEVLILTCGHIFRDSKGMGRIEVDLYCGNTPKRVPGVCLRYDDEKLDLGLVKIAPQFNVDVIPVAPPMLELQEGMTLISTGCDNGGNPTVRQHHVRSLTNTSPYVGASFHYIQVDNAPVQGRSGGGLFTENGCLVGVCVAGSSDDDEGLFVPASIIRNMLDNAKLSCVYQTPSVTRSQTSPVVLASAAIPIAQSVQPVMPTNPPVSANSASRNSPQSVAVLPDPAIRQPVFLPETDKANMIQPGFAVETQPIGTPGAPLASHTNALPPLTLRPSGFTETGLTDREIATLEEMQRRRNEGDEIILIVRSKRKPEQPCEVIQLSDVSPEFLNALTGQAAGQSSPPRP